MIQKTVPLNSMGQIPHLRPLKWGLGALWMGDGLLKLQPGMFTGALVINVLAANATDNQPHWLYRVMMTGVNFWHAGLPWTTVLMAVWEIALGLAFIGMHGKWHRITLWASVAWSAMVWVMAEGMGGIFTGSPTFPAGSPGSTPFYALGALLLLYPAMLKRPLNRWAGLFWWMAALVQVLPYNWSPTGVASIFGNVTMNGNEPVLVQQLINTFVLTSMHTPEAVNLVMVLVMACLGWIFWRGRAFGLAWLLTIAWLAFCWIIPQAFGTIFTGTGTDLGLEFPLVLLLWTVKTSPYPQKTL